MHSITKHVVMATALAVATGLLCSGCRIARRLGEVCPAAEREPVQPPAVSLPEPAQEPPLTAADALPP